MPVANSAFSRPRATSPRASASTLPCSLVITSANSSVRACSSSRNAKSTAARRDSEASRHPAAAAAADATAASTSAAEARSTSPVCSPVAGLNTGPTRPDVPATTAPSIQCEIRVGIPPSVGDRYWTAQRPLCYVTNHD